MKLFFIKKKKYGIFILNHTPPSPNVPSVKTASGTGGRCFPTVLSAERRRAPEVESHPLQANQDPSCSLLAAKCSMSAQHHRLLQGL